MAMQAMFGGGGPMGGRSGGPMGSPDFQWQGGPMGSRERGGGRGWGGGREPDTNATLQTPLGPLPYSYLAPVSISQTTMDGMPGGGGMGQTQFIVRWNTEAAWDFPVYVPETLFLADLALRVPVDMDISAVVSRSRGRSREYHARYSRRSHLEGTRRGCRRERDSRRACTAHRPRHSRDRRPGGSGCIRLQGILPADHSRRGGVSGGYRHRAGSLGAAIDWSGSRSGGNADRSRVTGTAEERFPAIVSLPEHIPAGMRQVVIDVPKVIVDTGIRTDDLLQNGSTCDIYLRLPTPPSPPGVYPEPASDRDPAELPAGAGSNRG